MFIRHLSISLGNNRTVGRSEYCGARGGNSELAYHRTGNVYPPPSSSLRRFTIQPTRRHKGHKPPAIFRPVGLTRKLVDSPSTLFGSAHRKPTKIRKLVCVGQVGRSAAERIIWRWTQAQARKFDKSATIRGTTRRSREGQAWPPISERVRGEGNFRDTEKWTERGFVRVWECERWSQQQ